jgi:peptidoglycan/LPS O-acetylase OafA/YrhL
VFLVALGVHVIAGLTCVVSGTVACLARKRAGRHPRWGRVYLCGLGAVAVSAAVMAVVRRPLDNHLLAVAVVAAGLGGLGWVARRRRRPGWPLRHAAGLGGSFAALLTGFYVDNGPQLPIWDRLPHLTYWVLPGLVATVLIRRALRRFGAGAPTRPPSGAPRAGA